MFITYHNKPEKGLVKLNDVDYIVNITDDSISVYHNDKSFVGTVKLQGQLDSLLIDDNQ